MNRYCLLLLLLFCADVAFSQTREKAPSRDARNTAKELPQEEQAETEKDSEEAKEVEKPNPYFERLVPTVRSIQRRYDQATRLQQAGRFPEAAQLLGSILEESVDFFLPPPPNKDGSKFFSRTTNRLFAEVIVDQLRELPSKGRESYAIQYETQAKRLLEDAVARGSFEGLQRVAKHYFPTTSGALATFLIALDQFDRGDRNAALLSFRRLERGHFSAKNRNVSELASFEPTFSLTTALCQLQLDREDEARATIDRFLERFPDRELLFAGKEAWTPRATDEILVRLKESLGGENIAAADWIERTGWLLATGAATQNPETRADLPLLDLLWSVPTLSQPRFAPRANSVQGHVDRAHEVYIPALQPLFMEDRLFMRGIGELTAVDARTGKRLWSASEPEYRIHRAVQAPFRLSFRRLPTIPQLHQFALRIFFWHDRISHQMSSDGKRLFTVEGLDLLPLTSYQHWAGGGRRNIQIGNKSVEDPRNQAGNTIAARDAATGRILWQTGKFPYAQKIFDRLAEEYERTTREKNAAEKPFGDEERADKDGKKPENDSDAVVLSEEEIFLGETWFLGAPLPIRGRLYLIGENAGVLRLFVLESETGRMIAQQPLAQAPTSFESDWLRRYYGLMPSTSGGIVLCPTGLGLVVALDAGTATPLWCFSYHTPSDELQGNRNQFQQTRYFHFGTSGSNDEFRNMFSKTGWQIPCMMIDEGRVLVAPPDVPALYCLDLLTGELLWQRDGIKRDDALYVACIRNGTAYVVTPVSMVAFSMKTGEPVWQTVWSEPPVPNLPGQSGPLPVPFRPGVPLPGAPKKADGEIAAPTSETAPAAGATESLPKLVFPHSLRPVGVGVHNAGRYFLPLSGGCLGVVDLDRAAMELSVSPFTALPRGETAESPSIESTSDDFETETTDVLTDSFTSLRSASPDWSPAVVSDTLASEVVPLGNLLGIQGRFFSQTPLQAVCFDQWEALRRRADERLAADPEDSEGLFQSGRIRCAEGNVSEAVDLFRRSLRSKRSEVAVDALRKTLLAAVRNDYSTWASSGPELESLAEFPEELGEILFALACGSLRNGNTEAFVDALQKAVRLESEHLVSIAVDSRWTSRLHQALGIVLEQQFRKEANPAFAAKLQQVSESIFSRFASGGVDPEGALPNRSDVPAARSNRFLTRPWWEQDSPASAGEIRRWSVFEALFRCLPIADQARERLENLYEKNRLFVSLEMSLNPPVFWALPESVMEKPYRIKLGSASKTPEEISITLENGSGGESSLPLPPLPDPAPDIDVPRRLAAILESEGACADAHYYYRMLKELYGEPGEKLYREALERPEMKAYYDREVAPVSWPTGSVQPTEGETSPFGPHLDRQNPHGWAALQILRSVRSNAQIPTSRATLPFLGTYEPFLSPYRFSMETSHHDVYLVCQDEDGKERWRYNLTPILPGMTEYGYFTDHQHYRQGVSDQTVYLKGCNHLLLFVRGNTIVAMDTFDCGEEGEPKVLWTRTATGSLQSRQLVTALNLHQIVHSIGPQGARLFPRESVFVSPQVVCYRDVDRVFGLDPVTGRALWSREAPSGGGGCSIFGDRKHLFLVYPETRQAIALDPSSGKELSSGTIPSGAVLASETNLVFVEPVAPAHNTKKPTSRILVGDLRDLTGLPGRASTSGVGETTREPAIPTYTIREGLSNESLIRPVCDDRFLASVSWETRTLQIYDLRTKRDLLGPEGDWGRRTGVKLPEFQSKNPQSYNSDFDVEWYDDKFLVLFVEQRNVDSTQKNETEDGVDFKRIRAAVNNVACRGVGVGSLMLFDPDGTPCWKEATRINDWFRMMNVPSRSPLVLLTFAANDQEIRGVNHFSTALCGIDKRTGRIRFRSLIPPLPNRPQTMLQGFHVVLDRERKLISFVAPNRTVDAVFTDRKSTPPRPSPAAPPAKPENRRFWNFDFNFEFGR